MAQEKDEKKSAYVAPQSARYGLFACILEHVYTIKMEQQNSTSIIMIVRGLQL